MQQSDRPTDTTPPFSDEWISKIKADDFACMEAEDARLRSDLALADRVIYRLELGGEPWTDELMAARDAAIARVKEKRRG